MSFRFERVILNCLQKKNRYDHCINYLLISEVVSKFHSQSLLMLENPLLLQNAQKIIFHMQFYFIYVPLQAFLGPSENTIFGNSIDLKLNCEEQCERHYHTSNKFFPKL